MFLSLAPCRLYDSRFGGNLSLKSANVRIVQAVGLCNIPRGARALSANITIVAPPAAGFLQAYAGDQPPPATSAVNFRAGQTKANNAMIQLALGGDGTIALLPIFGDPGTLDVIVDVNGYVR